MGPSGSFSPHPVSHQARLNRAATLLAACAEGGTAPSGAPASLRSSMSAAAPVASDMADGAEEAGAPRGQPLQLQVVQEVGGDGLAHGPPSNIPHSKCNYNEEWDGWRPRFVCRRMNIEFKEREDCNE